MSKQLRLDVAQLTDVGRRRDHNEDNMAYVIPKDPQVMARKGALFIVADGMGGHAAGEVASEIAVDTVSNVYYQDDSDDVAVSLVHAIKRANTLIHQRAAENMTRIGMGTTCVAAVFRGNMACVANVGDSRAYMIRNSQSKQVSRDHSWVEEQVRAGLLTRDQARSHAQRNVITRCLGTQAEVEIDVFAEQLEENDTLLLCSDGLSGPVGDEELRAIVDQYVPQESVYHLVERANENGGPDNITAIVVRVLEVGLAEPPATRHPAYVGGRDASEEATAMLSRLPNTTAGTSRLDAGAPAPIPTGPLLPKEGVNTPQPALTLSRNKRSRLFYPTVALLILLVVALVGYGAYYFLRIMFNPPIDVDASLAKASIEISQAKGEATSNPSDALKQLITAQKLLNDVKNSTLTDAQQKDYDTLIGDFVPAVKSSIISYNQQASITALPCQTTTSPTINGNTQINSIAVIQDNKGNIVPYALGTDHNLYQINGTKLGNKQADLNNAMMITAFNQHMLVLTQQAGQGQGNTPTYSLDLLMSADDGTLTNNTLDISSSFTKGGQAPTSITIWDNDVYVLLTSTSAQNTATILDYPINGNNKLDNPRSAKISISTSIISIAGWPDHKLFFLHSDGSVQSLQFDNGDNGGGGLQATSVQVQRPISTPLSVSANDFTQKVNVPTPGASPSSFLSVPLPAAPRSSFLSVAKVDDTPHLYIVDGMYHRILDLKQTQNNTAPTPTVSSGSNGTGGGTSPATPSVTMVLLQQYASPDLLNLVKGVSADPKNPKLYLLTSNGQNLTQSNLLSVDTSKKTACNALKQP